MSKIIRAYQEIKSITLADKHNVYEVIYHGLPSLADLTYEDGTIETDYLLLTKGAVMADAAHIVVSGYGSRGKVWQLSQELQNQIKKTMVKSDIL